MSKFFKRLFDIVASASGLIFLSPVFLILIYLIRKNPVSYTHLTLPTILRV